MQYAHNIDHILIIAAVLLFMTVFVKCLSIISKHLVCRCFTSLSGHAGNDCQTKPIAVYCLRRNLETPFPGRVFTAYVIQQHLFLSWDDLSTVFELPGGLGGLNPPTSPCRPPYLWSKFDPGGVEFQPPPHLSFAEVGMLLNSHFLLMQFLKYLGLYHDDLILLHLDSYFRLLLSSPGLSVKFLLRS